MKYILQIVASLRIGGAEKVARDIGLFSEPSEYQNHYIVFENKIQPYEQALLDHECKIFHIASPGANYISYIKTLKNLMREYNYSAVHVHTMFNAGWAMYVAKQMKVPVRIAHAHSSLDIKGGLSVKAYETLMRHLILSCATDLIACGEKAGIRLFGEKAYGERARLIFNGIDTDIFAFNSVSRNKIRSRYKLSNCFVIGNVGHLEEVKNQKYLLKLFPEILKIKPNAKLLLLGEGEDRPMLEQMISDLGLQDKVIMTGNVLNVYDYLSAMDVFAFPSYYEGMPLSIIEVQANGMPCVLSTGVPKDVYLTDLIQPINLEDSDQWVEAICEKQRKCSEQYADMLKASGFDVSSAMKKIYGIYERKT